MSVIIGHSTIKHFPLKPEPIEAWDETCDLLALLLDLFDTPAVMEHEQGTQENISYRVYGMFRFADGVERAIQLAAAFGESAAASIPSIASTVATVEVPDFIAHPEFGLAMKHLIVWDCIVSQVLQESAYFSLAHVLETATDLESSADLACQMYYKQAMLSLRVFLESMVLPVVFIDNQSAFRDWRAGSYQTPSLRGKKGVLKQLVVNGTLDQRLADRISVLYGNLNAYVHGAEARLIHSGMHSGSYRGHIFLPDQLSEWSRHVTEAVELGAHLMAIQAARWQQRRQTGTCFVCHGTDLSEENVPFGKKTLVQRICATCGHTCHLSRGTVAPVVTLGDGERLVFTAR